MRAGYTVSILGHVAILGLGLVAYSSSRPLEAEKIEALPVELVSIAEMTDLLQGSKSSEVLPEENPQPKPTVEAEIPAPEPVEEPAEKPVEAVTPPPPAPEPESVPEPEPEEEVAALPPAPDVVVEPEPAAPAEAPVPKPRPAPPKPVVEPKPEPPKPPAVAQPEQPEPEFNPDDIAALLNKQDPVGGGDPAPNPEPQTLGSIEGHEGAAMTQSEIAALKARLYRCWKPPVAVREAGALVVEVRITLLPDGSLAGEPQITGVTMVSDPLAQVAAEAAVRAVVQCAPFGDILRPETYALWNTIDFVFDPREMLGG
jgi:outer membrane biosynthesis protein TonB